MKKLLIAIVLIALIIIAVFMLRKEKDQDPVVTTSNQDPIQLCFYNETKTSQGMYDKAWLIMNLAGTTVTGEFHNLPAEKDSKVGTFEGVVGPVDRMAMARTADVWWNSLAEGMHVTEQLKIMFGEGTAQVAFGEMTDRGDGTYVYKDLDALVYSNAMSDVACQDLDDRILVEKYVREHITALAPEEAILGGSWYVLSVHIEPSTKTGIMSYEDGHIQGSASFTYTRTGNRVSINDINKLQ